MPNKRHLMEVLKPLIHTLGSTVYFAVSKIDLADVEALIKKNVLSELALKCNTKYTDIPLRTWLGKYKSKIQNEIYRQGTKKVLNIMEKRGLLPRKRKLVDHATIQQLFPYAGPKMFSMLGRGVKVKCVFHLFTKGLDIAIGDLRRVNLLGREERKDSKEALLLRNKEAKIIKMSALSS